MNDLERATRLYTVPEVAALLRVSRATVWRLLRTGELPCTRVRGATRVRAADLDEFVKNSVERRGG